MSKELTIAEKQALTLAEKFNIPGNPAELISTLKATVFKGEATNEQFNALMIVAAQHALNPFTKEIYAFPDKSNGITPVVGVDGWASIINRHEKFDGMEFNYSSEMTQPEGAKSKAHEWVECVIYRKDRSHPIVAREYLDEVYRPPFKTKYGDVTGPWQSHTKRMHRHKAMIQAARLAFGFTGIYDEDEAERIKDANDGVSEAEVSPFRGDTNSNERAELIATGETVAMRGVDELRDWLKSIGRESRNILGVDEMERLKAVAENTVTAEVVE
ncbi:phage recombination protein Bet [Neisseria arctica]|uniref:phage recombination protein Bet n=1 Tax=Neisseria arctica TaxID=1470200 RepID=UPI00064A5DC4|nr:phage recombination protein Bet [Neisseria arctica]UOO87458.1 phage recombination protein Bet [Neisseria arctica]